MINASPTLTFSFRLTYSTWHPLILQFKYWLTRTKEREYRLRKCSSKSLSIFVIKYVWPVTPLITLPVQQRIDTSARELLKNIVGWDLLLTPVKPNALQLFNLARWNRLFKTIYHVRCMKSCLPSGFKKPCVWSILWQSKASKLSSYFLKPSSCGFPACENLLNV